MPLNEQLQKIIHIFNEKHPKLVFLAMFCYTVTSVMVYVKLSPYQQIFSDFFQTKPGLSSLLHRSGGGGGDHELSGRHEA